jgi:hypothetical protein
MLLYALDKNACLEPEVWQDIEAPRRPLRVARLVTITLVLAAGFLSLTACDSSADGDNAGGGPAGAGGSSGTSSQYASGSGVPWESSHFRAIAAEFVTPRQVRVTFTEEVADASAVDAAQFRLSYAHHAWCYDDECDEYGIDYEDPAHVVGLESRFIAITRDPSLPATLLLDLETDMPAEACDQIDNPEDELGPGEGMVLHFGNLDIGGPLLDVHGHALEPFGEDWVRSPNWYFESLDDFSEMVTPLLIPCTLNDP